MWRERKGGIKEMHRASAETFLVLVIAVAAIWDGIRITGVSERTIGTAEAGGYIAGLGIILACLTLAYFVRTAVLHKVNRFDWGNHLLRTVTAFGILLVYILSIGYLGYLLSTALFLIVYLRIFSPYRIMIIVVGSLLVSALSAYLWAALGMMLPSGILPWP